MSEAPRALITGITGQDGSYMAELLLSKGFEVFGIVRRKPREELGLASHLEAEIEFDHGDVTDKASVSRIIESVRPGEIYHFAAQSHVGESFKQKELTLNTNVHGTLNVLEAAAGVGGVRLYNACSSEMFGRIDAGGAAEVVTATKQNELTPFRARSPYAVSKITQFHLGCVFRDMKSVAVWNGIAFNHESERRPVDFVTRKITRWVAEAMINAKHVMGLEAPVLSMDPPPLTLGNLEVWRDWGYAPDYCEAFHAMLQGDGMVGSDALGNDYVVATGVATSLREFLTTAFEAVGIKGSGWKPYVQQDPQFMRPADVPYLCGDATKLRKATGWEPKTDIRTMVTKMIEADIEALGGRRK